MAFLNSPPVFQGESTQSRSRNGGPRCSTRVAFVRGVPSTVPNGILAPGASASDVNVETAKKQHSEYVKLLQRHMDTVHELPIVEACPDSVFVEDAAVVLGRKALQGVAGHPARRGEIELLTPWLQEQGIEVHKVEMRLDGGDILFIQGKFFVGVSARTELLAAAGLSEWFSCDAIPITVADGTLHLKCVVTWVNAARLLVVQDSDVGRSVLRQMREAVKHADWQIAWVSETVPQGANVLDLGDAVVLQRAAWDDMQQARTVLENAGVQPVPCDMSELMKANGALTCCSILTALE